MTRKILNLTIACLLVVCIMAGCTSDGPGEITTAPIETTVHTHAAGAEWEWNGTEHWHLCACGEKMDAAAHNLGDEVVCADCGVEVWDFGDGYVDVISYDEYGQTAGWISYGPDGEVLSASVYEREYDANGNLLKEKLYDNDRLAEEWEYAVSEDDGSYPVMAVYYNEDGGYFTNEYDAAGNVTRLVSYDADGHITYDDADEYTLNANGEYYNSRGTTIYENGEKLIAEYNEYEDITRRESYDAEGNLTSVDVWEYEYNDEGDPVWQKWYIDGELYYEIVGYTEWSDGDMWWRFPETDIRYYSDGSKLVCQYGENSRVATETLYNADGSAAYVHNYVYETFEDGGNWKSIKIYENETLISETEYVMDEENIWSRKASMTEYHEDGTKTVYIYDENEYLVSETNYDADGNEIR